MPRNLKIVMDMRRREMSRYIDADALMEDMSKWLKQVDPTHPPEDNALPPMEDIIVSTLMTIEEQPTADVVPVRKGKWVTDVAFYDEEGCPCIVTRCDQCGEVAEMTTYCPNCGAKMERTEE